MGNEKSLRQEIETIARLIVESEYLVAFTGAGISTESGIPDFRGPDGVWTRRDAGLPAPKWKVPQSEVKPNSSHIAMVELAEIGKLKFLITQNTDNLHRKSGIEPELLAELHGNGKLVRCLECDRQYTRESVGWDPARFGPGYRTQRAVPGQPACPDCGGRLISSVVNFGDPMPEKEMELSAFHALSCDLMLVLGSSLMVNPAASLVGLAIETGANVILINQGDTPYDDAATFRSRASIGDVFPQAVSLARREMI
ncbi:MAG: NAD-dependent deacetylase [Acidobacteria bacterium]|jgi:NAD-dependent deacetylase|nr:NAD-dependent deacetylase [Acidobacteriota bacterium]